MQREQLKNVYLDWVNNYVSIDTFSDHYGLHKHEAETLIELARCIYNNPHPEA